MEKLVLRILVLVLLGASVGLAFMTQSKVMIHLPVQQQQPNGPTGPTGTTGTTGGTGVAQPPTGPTGVANHAPEAPNAAATFIDMATAKQKFDEKSAIFVDAREFIEYRDGHIAGAMSVPKRRFDGAVPKYIRDFLPGSAVVVYCHGAECTDSEAVVKRLIALNLQIGPYYILKDGYPGWQEMNKKDPKGYPINTGDSEGYNS